MSNNITPIFGRLKNVTKENPYVAGAVDIKDDVKDKDQQVINQETDEHFDLHDTEIADRYTKEEVNNIVSRTPETDVIVFDVPSEYQSDIAAYLDANTPSGTDPETGKSVRANKLYRVPGPDNTTYSEWAWDGTSYIMLANKDYGIDDEPTKNSDNMAKSGGIWKQIDELTPKNSVHDFSIQDGVGNAIVDFDNGHIRTKEFDSKEVTEDLEKVKNRLGETSSDFAIADDMGNNLVKFKGGHIKTKNFNSKETPALALTDSDFAVSDEEGNNVLKVQNGHIKTKHFDSETAIHDEFSIESDLSIADEEENVIVRFKDGHIRTQKFDSKNVGYAIPDYYQDEITRVLNAYYGYSEAGRIGYVFITDLHFSSNSANNECLLRQINAAVKIANDTSIDFLAFGGDIIDGTDTKSIIYSAIQQVNDILAKCNKPILFISGNHDDNSYSSSHTSEKGAIARNMFVDITNMANPVFGSADKEDCYYYFELPKKNVRVICLDYIDFPANKDGRSWWGFSEAQVKWFCSKALNTDKDIMVFSHGQLVDKRYGWYGLEDNGGYTTDIKNAIIAFNNKTSITLYGITYDFTGKQGKIILSQNGHWHGDMELSIGNMPAIITGCAKHSPADLYGYVTNGYYQPVVGKEDTFIIPDQAAATAIHANGYDYEFVIPSNRDYNTINEALFDVVSVNSFVAHFIRFGAGFDRDINL